MSLEARKYCRASNLPGAEQVGDRRASVCRRCGRCWRGRRPENEQVAVPEKSPSSDVEMAEAVAFKVLAFAWVFELRATVAYTCTWVAGSSQWGDGVW